MVSKPAQNQVQAGPLQAIVVIFSLRIMIYFRKLLENMKDDNTFVRMRSGGHQAYPHKAGLKIGLKDSSEP